MTLVTRAAGVLEELLESTQHGTRRAVPVLALAKSIRNCRLQPAYRGVKVLGIARPFTD